MTDQYDVIVIGAGHSGLTAALELKTAGLSVMVVEAQSRIGGCGTTEETLLPGFRHNPHANVMMFAELMPKRITPGNLGACLHWPAAQLGVTFEDGRPPVILHRPDLLERTFENLSVFSQADASTYVSLKQCSEPMGAIIRQGLFAPPDADWFRLQIAAVHRAFSALLDTRALGMKSARSLIDGAFQSPEVRLLLYHLASETGVTLDEPGSDIAFLGYSLWLAGRWRTVNGGMGAYVDALGATVVASGAVVVCSSRVERILIRDGRAAGVQMETGGRHLAIKAVLSAAPIVETIGMIDAGRMSSIERDEIQAFRNEQPATIACSTFCLTKAPKYKSARHNPEIDACLKTVVGHASPDDFIARDADIRSGLLPRPSGVVRVHSVWDPELAPNDHHIAGVDSNFPSPVTFDPETWRLVESSFAEAFVKVWREHCEEDFGEPLAMRCDATSGFERRMLMRFGPDQYRTSISGLYLGGPGMYPGGGVHGACGYNAAKVLLSDLRALQSDPEGMA